MKITDKRVKKSGIRWAKVGTGEVVVDQCGVVYLKDSNAHGIRLEDGNNFPSQFMGETAIYTPVFVELLIVGERP